MPVFPAGYPALRRLLAITLLALGILSGLASGLTPGLMPGLMPGLTGSRPAWAQDAPPARSSTQIEVLEIDGVIDRTTTGFLRQVLQRANEASSDLVVIQLQTPGGLGVDADELIEMITASDVPVLTFLPTGGRASGAGVVVASASHVLAASPVSRFGAAAPVDLKDPDAPLQDLTDRLVGLAQTRNRNVEFAEAAVTENQVLAVLAPGAQASDIDPSDVPEAGDLLALRPQDAVEGGFVDLVEPTLAAVLDRLDGYEVRVEGAAGAGTRVLSIDGDTAAVRFHNPGLVAQILSAVANPTLAYLLLIAGALAIAFEVFQPGFGVSGVSGLIMIGLAIYALVVLPVNWLAFVLVVLGVILLSLDLAVAGLGPLTIGGTLTLAAGSFLLFDGPNVLQVSPWVIVPVVVFTVVFFVVIMTTVLRAQGNQAMVGAEAVIGQTGVVRSMLNPEGHIFVRGALWRARAPEAAGRVKTGTQVRVVGLNDQLTLDVELVDVDTSTPVS